MEVTDPSVQEIANSPAEGVLMPATMNDIDDIRRVLQEASEFKYSRGDDLWGTKPFSDEEVSSMIESGNMFVYKIDGTIAASALLLEDDERMWGNEQGNDGSALYIHRLNSGNAYRGQGVGAKLISLAEDLAIERGRTKLRLDCRYDGRLYKYYTDLGFSEIRRYDRSNSAGGRSPEKDVYKAALLEKELTVSSTTE